MSFEPRDYLRHILVEADYLIARSHGPSYAAFSADETLRRAFVRRIDHRRGGEEGAGGFSRGPSIARAPLPLAIGRQAAAGRNMSGRAARFASGARDTGNASREDNVQTGFASNQPDDHGDVRARVAAVPGRSANGRRRILGRASVLAAVVSLVAVTGQSTAGAQATLPHGTQAVLDSPTYKPRTVITTDGEQDDQASMIRYLMYADEFQTVGLVYSASQWHWAGDGFGTTFNGFRGPATSFRWLGTLWIDEMLSAYTKESGLDRPSM